MCVCAPLLEAYWNDDHRGLDCRYAVLLLGLLDLLLVQRDPRGEKTKWGKKNKIKSKGTSLARPRTYSSPLSLSLPLTISHFHFPLLSLFSSFFFGFFFLIVRHTKPAASVAPQTFPFGTNGAAATFTPWLDAVVGGDEGGCWGCCGGGGGD